MNSSEKDGSESSITRLLMQWSTGEDEALRKLLPLIYSRLHELAISFMRRQRPDHTLQPTALISELYIRLTNAVPPDVNNREHFFSLCARTMRWILADHARRRQAEKRQQHLQIPFTEDIPWLGLRESDTLDLDRALSKLAEFDPRAAQVIELRIFLGCTATEAAGLLNISKPTVDRILTMSRAWLCRELRADDAPAPGSVQ
jgi:RNA polymerase sigma factor (TIGR02999 family)